MSSDTRGAAPRPFFGPFRSMKAAVLPLVLALARARGEAQLCVAGGDVGEWATGISSAECWNGTGWSVVAPMHTARYGASSSLYQVRTVARRLPFATGLCSVFYRNYVCSPLNNYF